jgi:hypothetical protein
LVLIPVEGQSVPNRDLLEEHIGTRIDAGLAGELDTWRGRQNPPLSRGRAIRMLLAEALALCRDVAAGTAASDQGNAGEVEGDVDLPVDLNGPTAALHPEPALSENWTNPRTPAEEAWLSSKFPRGAPQDALDRLSVAYRAVMATGAIERGSRGYFQALEAAIK